MQENPETLLSISPPSPHPHLAPQFLSHFPFLFLIPTFFCISPAHPPESVEIHTLLVSGLPGAKDQP